jgi:hypothetical protein
MAADQREIEFRYEVLNEKIETLCSEIRRLSDKLDARLDGLDNRYVTKAEFGLFKKIVFSTIGGVSTLGAAILYYLK